MDTPQNGYGPESVPREYYEAGGLPKSMWLCLDQKASTSVASFKLRESNRFPQLLLPEQLSTMIQCPKCNSPIFHPRALVDSDDSQKISQRLRDPAQVAEEETVRVKHILHDAESQIASYDAQIAQLEEALSVLRHKHKCLQDYVAKHRSLLAPIRRLPPEILILIFLIHCRRSPILLSLGSSNSHQSESSAIFLSQVSIGWRRVALTSPHLWSYLDLSIRDNLTRRRNKDKDKAGFQHHLSFYLKRSLQVPLTVYLHMEDSSDSDGDWHAAFGKILQPVYRRCSSLVIDCFFHCQFPVHTLSIASITDLPCLEYLKLPADSLMEGWSPALPTYQAPRLRHLEITTMYQSRPLEFSSSVFQQFPWAQITTFELSMLHVLELWKFLGRCTRLSELIVWGVNWSTSLARFQDYLDFVNTPESFTLPHLISINFNFVDSNNLGCALSVLFSKLTASALKHLTIRTSRKWTMFEDSGPTWPLDVFNNFVARSADPGSGLFMLSSLRIDKFPITVLGLLAVLNCLPFLSELEITEHRGKVEEERLISDELLYGLHQENSTGITYQ
ncbi:hypothetical protein K435DRAFT_851542 [Dendrothele bispora CBS 962.96]|uniref:Uncharacterized protein n=1 Tax=Dendrothele bispora (strain CBS 962.96) TaxID=1314807 RepID=A0A4S8MLH6_DENBC|nr:hypothetical protein K435DRAFT_851542 [Dendrothele bispora CBS 962.96]